MATTRRFATVSSAFTRSLASPRVAPFLAVAALAGYLLAVGTLLGLGNIRVETGGSDTLAYWNAGQALLHGAPVYGGDVGVYVAYLYPPPFIQMVAPWTLLPFSAFLWLWRGMELLCLRSIVGSWRGSGIVLLLWWPVVSELDFGNVHLLIAAGVAAAIRGDARAIGPLALTKFASLAAVPMAWRHERRGLLLGGALAAGICLVSLAATPTLWNDYLTFLSQAHEPQFGWPDIGSFVSTPLRLALAGTLALAAWRWRRMAAVAVTLAMPVLWFHSLSTLVAIVARPPATTVVDEGVATVAVL